MERFEVFSLGKHYLHVHTEKGFTLYANAKLVNGRLTSYTDKMVRRGGSWVIDVWKFLNKRDFPVNPIYTAVFGFDSEDTAVSVTGTDINVDSISGVNGQLVDIGNISLAEGQSLPVQSFFETDSIEWNSEIDQLGQFRSWVAQKVVDTFRETAYEGYSSAIGDYYNGGFELTEFEFLIWTSDSFKRLNNLNCSAYVNFSSGAYLNFYNDSGLITLPSDSDITAINFWFIVRNPADGKNYYFHSKVSF